MIIILIISSFIIYNAIIFLKYQIAKRKKAHYWDLEEYKTSMVVSFVFLIILIFFFSVPLGTSIRKYNEYYFKEKNEAELFIIENSIFSGTIVKWWTKNYPKIK